MGNGMAATIDTHAYIKRFINVGFTEEQAETQTDIINDAFIDFRNKNREDLATKIDIAEVKIDIAEVKSDMAGVKSDIAEVKSELKSDISEVKSDIAELKAETKAEIKVMKWMSGFMLSLVAAIFIMLLKSNLTF